MRTCKRFSCFMGLFLLPALPIAVNASSVAVAGQNAAQSAEKPMLPDGRMGHGFPDFTVLVKKVRAAVVNISTSKKPGQTDLGLPEHRKFHDLPEDAPLDEFLRKFFGERDNDDPGFDNESLGSGFIISKDGYILTNLHVVKDADQIVVRLSDRRQFDAKLVGIDKRSDIVLLKIEATDLPVIQVGNSAKVDAGEWVIAIGSPFGFDHSVTVGVVSATGRSLPNENYVPFIQTDVAINPGNSGGPLFNLDGKVIGINSQIFSRTGGYMGLSFAIPIDMAMDVVEQLKSKGKVTRGWLGVYIQDVTRELAESFAMEKPQGALITRVLPSSPAERSELRIGDIIVEFNGQPVHDSTSLPPLVGKSELNTRVPLKIMRNGEILKIPMIIGELPEEIETASGETSDKFSENTKLGISVLDLDQKQRENMDLSEPGILVHSVGTGPAREAGMRDGDVILMINGKSVPNSQTFAKIVENLPMGKAIPILIHRRNGPLFLALKIPKK